MIILLEIASETNTTLFIEIQEVFNIENKVGKKKSMEILTEVQKLRKTVSDLCKEVLDEQEKNKLLQEKRNANGKKVDILTKKIEHLNMIKIDLESECQNLKISLDSQTDEYVHEKELKNKVEKQLQKEREKFQDQTQDLENKVQEYEEQIEMNRNFKEECYHLQDLLSQEIIKNEDIRGELDEILKKNEHSRSCVLSKLESENKTLKGTVKNLRKFESDNENYEIKVQYLMKTLNENKKEIQQLQEMNDVAVTENINLKGSLNIMVKELDKLRKVNVEQKQEADLKNQDFQKERYCNINF